MLHNVLRHKISFFFISGEVVPVLVTRLIINEIHIFTLFRLDLVEVTGKRGRTVPIILTPEVRESIDLLNSNRIAIGLPVANPYVFARVNKQSLSYARGCDCLRKVTSSINLQQPKLITSTKLRKYIATVSQVASLSENDLDWVAKHLGHDIRIHRDFYRLHDSTIELAKVSKLLLAIDGGDIKALAGKSLKDIQLHGNAYSPYSKTMFVMIRSTMIFGTERRQLNIKFLIFFL